MTAPVAERTRILVVDDSMLMRKAAVKMLGDEFDVVTASDGEEGWERISNDHAIQVVFTDLMMPRLDGYGLLKQVRASEDEGTLNLPVIVVTGAENDEAARKKALDQGATDFITKPFSSVDLLARARAHANYRRITRKLEQQITQDALTGLANKAGLLDRLQQDLAFARRHAQPLTLVRIEIDDFRNLFLAHGKARAELAITHVAQRLRDCVRKEDTAARIGLAGFVALMPAGQHEGSRSRIDALRAQIESELIEADGRQLSVRVSAAVTTPALSPSATPQSLLDDLEGMLQEAIRAGGNRVLGDAPAATAEGTASPPATAAVAPRETQVAPPAATSAPKPALAAIVPPEIDSVDAVLHKIDRGEGQQVVPQLSQVLKRLMPLFRLLPSQQRAGLISYLQRLGD